MELANIEKLIEKYLDANTSLEEENALREYFTSNQVPVHLEEFGMLFGYFKESKNETFTKTIELTTKKKSKRTYKWLAVAGSLALMLSVYVGKVKYEESIQRQQLAQVKETLRMVSTQLNKGNDALYAVSNNLSKGNSAINELNTFPNTVAKANNIINNK